MKLEDYFNNKKHELLNNLRERSFSSVYEIRTILIDHENQIISKAVGDGNMSFSDRELVSPILTSYDLCVIGQSNTKGKHLSKKDILLKIWNLIKCFFYPTSLNHGSIRLSDDTIAEIMENMYKMFSIIDSVMEIQHTQITVIENENIREIAKHSLDVKYKNVLQTYQRILGDIIKYEDSRLSEIIKERVETDLMSMGYEIMNYNGSNNLNFDCRKTQSGEDKMVLPAINRDGDTILKGLIFIK